MTFDQKVRKTTQKTSTMTRNYCSGIQNDLKQHWLADWKQERPLSIHNEFTPGDYSTPTFASFTKHMSKNRRHKVIAPAVVGNDVKLFRQINTTSATDAKLTDEDTFRHKVHNDQELHSLSAVHVCNDIIQSTVLSSVSFVTRMESAL